jgi:uncharacterized protein
VTRAVVDPGVFISAFIGNAQGAPSRLVHALLAGEFELIAAPMLFDELTDVLARKKFAAAAAGGRATTYVEILRASATMLDDPDIVEGATRDPDDDYLIALARDAGADMMVSVDKDLLVESSEELPVLNPREFLAVLQTKAPTDAPPEEQ